ncbi:MAG: hypothetical protein AB7R89_11095 [Dehalococcoidia bacterium]
MTTTPHLDPDDIPPFVRAWLAAIGRYGASQREIVTVICAICGTATRGLKRRRYCSDTCRQTARRQRSRNPSR